MKTFVLASKNEHKAKEIQEILGAGFRVITQTEAGAGDIDIIEDGDTFEANAVKKAETIMRALNRPVIADDSGLCVDYLGGSPGVYTARYAGENATDQENIDKLLAAMDGVPFSERTARFVCVIALALPDGKTETFRGVCNGFINLCPDGDGGFGYDPIFYVESFGMTMGLLEPHIKNSISHRHAALSKLVEYLRKEEMQR